jgi:polar amino acid transport system substrate-binding protein
MLQILQHQRTGNVTVEDLPAPPLRPGGILVRTAASVISPGTERTSMETARASLLGKALRRPDLVRQTLDNIRREGILSSAQKVRDRLDSYKEVGYSCAGVVLDSNSERFRRGDAVACGGAEYAHHAEIVFVPETLAAPVPQGLSLDHAAFATLVAIGINSVRLARVQVGENVLVIGLGLIGLLTAQVLHATGCTVAGMDISERNFGKALLLGINRCFKEESSVLEWGAETTGGHGFDCVIVTAGSRSSVPVELAVSAARRRGRVVLVGDVTLSAPRALLYDKELELVTAMSYGPGRYDKSYEQLSRDYPYPYVRWTAGRNIETALALMQSGRVQVDPLITHRFEIREAAKAYTLLSAPQDSPLGILITYPGDSRVSHGYPKAERGSPTARSSLPVVGVIGAGNFAVSHILPYLKGARLAALVTQHGSSGMTAKERFGFEYCFTDAEELFANEQLNTLVIATRHDSHASYVCRGLERGMTVFVEKPLAITLEQLEKIADVHSRFRGTARLSVGFNRRHSKPWKAIKEFMKPRCGPLQIMYRVSAGSLPRDHWLFLPGQGGRIAGEVCHFVDTIAFLTGSDPVNLFASSPRGNRMEGDVVVTLEMSDGSSAVIFYATSGSTLVNKEYAEIYSGDKTAIFDNFRKVTFLHKRKSTVRKYDGSKGYDEEVRAFLDMAAGRPNKMQGFEELYAVTRATLGIEESLRTGSRYDLGR